MKKYRIKRKSGKKHINISIWQIIGIILVVITFVCIFYFSLSYYRRAKMRLNHPAESKAYTTNTIV